MHTLSYDLYLLDLFVQWVVAKLAKLKKMRESGREAFSEEKKGQQVQCVQNCSAIVFI